jgi:uncharacterized membrane protein YhhN
MARLRALPVYTMVAATDVALAAAGRRRGRRFTKPLLMPLLMADVARERDVNGTKGLLLAALGLSGAGDIALLGDTEAHFTIGLAAFLGAHTCYLAAMWRQRQGGLRRRPWVAVVYGGAALALNVVLWPLIGRLRVPVLVYSSALLAMALAAVETGRAEVAAGGVTFLISDGILAMETFGAASVPLADGLVMLTYTAAQALIADGMIGPGR